MPKSVNMTHNIEELQQQLDTIFNAPEYPATRTAILNQALSTPDEQALPLCGISGRLYTSKCRTKF